MSDLEEAQKRIAACRRDLALKLDLMSLKLGTIPDEVFELTWLEELDLRNCELIEIPPEISTLRRLRTLNASQNQLEELPPEIGELTDLFLLVVSDNSLKSLPAEIGRLGNLTQLWLEHNEFSELPPEIGSLTKLQNLGVGGNLLTMLPLEMASINPYGLSYGNNPWTEPLAKAWNRGWNSVRAYLRGLADAQKCYEAKLVLVGEGNVGKTSLVAALREESFVENRSTTHGIEVRSFEVDHPEKSDIRVRLNSWDFGGQAVYRITHQFFFSRRSLFLVVWWPREGVEQNDVEGWIERIQLRVGNDARVLVVASHCTEHGRVPRINQEALKRRFGDIIVGFHAVDSREMHNIDELKTAVAQAASHLPQMGEDMPTTWQKVREEIRQLKDVQIPLGRFREVCAKHELEDDAISALANLMNDLGDVVYFSDAEGLKETMILNPEWLTKAIGYVLEDQQTNAGAGLLAWNRLHEIWSSDRPDREDYPRDKHPFFLRLMEQFDISFRLGDSTSLVGQLVPASEPEEVQPWKDAAQSDDLVLVCRLSADAPGLISWLIVRTHWYSQNIHWQSGMLLNHAPHGEALIELVGRNLQITVRATYPTYFADILKDTVDFLISDRWPGLTSQWAVPCTKDDCSGLSNLSVLKTRQTKKESDVSCPECGEDLQIDQLLLWVPSDDLDVDLEVSTVQGIEAVGSDDLKKSLPTHAAWIMRCVRKTAPKNMRFFSCRAIDESTWAYRAWCDAPGCEHPRDLIDGSGRGIIHSHPPSHFFRHDEAEQLSEVLRIRTTYPDQDMPQQLLPLTVGTDQEFESMRTWGTESEKPVAQKPPQKEKSEPGDTVRSVGFVLGAGRLLSQLEFISRTPMWGLNRYVGPDGQQLHLCEFHHSKFDPGLPEIPETAEETTTLPVVRPFSLKSVRIKNFRGIESLEVPLAAESDLDGTWCCLAGINGAGKTAILEAIALAMIGPDAVMEIGGGRLARMIRQDPEIKDAEITLKVSRGTDESTTLYMALSRRSEGNAIVNRELIEHNASSDAERVREELQRHLFVSYGATRNLSDNEESIQVDVSPIVERQWTLFQPLSHIPGINVIFGNNKKNSARVKVIRAFIRKLFDVGSLEVSETQDDLSLVFKQGGSDVDSFQLPDGYRSTIGWLADLCSEWHRLDREAAEANHFEKMAGVVLIDEIDLHLHPSLQRSLVPKLRRLLPHVQFIVTTHSPMVLASFDQNELVLLEQNGGKLGIRNVDRQIFGFSMNQIYRWLLDTSSHSPVIDELIAAGEDEEVVRHLYLSTDEEELVAEERFLKQQASLRNLRERGPQE